MKIRKIATTSLIAASMIACEPVSSPAIPSNDAKGAGREDKSIASQSHASAPASSSSAQLGAQYEKDMAYSDFRKLALSDGWNPAGDRAGCLLITVGDNYRDECSKDPEQHGCKVCSTIPELSACSYDGTCYVSFAKGKNSLEVTLYGEISDIDNPRGNPPLVVKWMLSKN